MTVEWILGIVVFAFLLLVTFFPKAGLLALIQAWRISRRREHMEDALKYLLNRERQGQHTAIQTLAAALKMPMTKVEGLVVGMRNQGLVEFEDSELHLTPEGERGALHIVRAHRLWERYLADEARMPLKRIHREAHRHEHRLSTSELDRLDAALGYPSHDPHGDPIPNREGEMAVVDCASLVDWPADRLARIIHLEDEPAIAYQQILAAGLYLGQVVRVLETSPERMVLSDGENEYRLAPSVAANVYVEPVAEAEKVSDGAVPLDALADHQQAEVVRLDDSVQGFTRRRFLDLGLTPGALIYPELHNFFGDPRAYRIRGTLIALRKDQARLIWVKTLA